ncbi:hypothetical protein T439DRAFT_324370 [Meredithblackwellia eburnea MCA 4105]
MTKRACDACHQRRIKCSNESYPCVSCLKADLECTYNKLPKKKGPAGKVLTRLRESKGRQSVSPVIDSVSLPSVTSSDVSPPVVVQSLRVEEEPRPWTGVDAASLFDFGSLLELDGLESGIPSFGGMGWPDPMSAAEAAPGEFSRAPPPRGWGMSPGPAIVPPAPHFASPGPAHSVPEVNPIHPGANLNGPSNLPYLPAPPPSFSRTTPVPPNLSWMPIIANSVLRPQIDIFFDRVQPVLPIFTRSYILDRLAKSEHLTNPDFASMLLALCGFTLIQPVQADEAAIKERTQQAMSLMDEATRLRSSCQFGQGPNLDSVICSFFLFASLFGLGSHNAAFFRLREAITLGETLELHRPLSYAGLESEERAMRVRVFWVLSVTERAYAVQRNHSITFKGRPGSSMALVGASPLKGEHQDSAAVMGLQRLTMLFDFIDEDIVACWNGHCLQNACPTLTVQRVVELHRGLAASMSEIPVESPRMDGRSVDVQQADLLVTQQWLRNRVWQLSVAHGLASALSPHVELRPSYAISIAQTLLSICHKFSQSALEGNGIGHAEKIHDVALTVIMIINVSPSTGDGRDDPLIQGRTILPQLISVLAAFRGGQHPFLQPVVDSWNRIFEHST